MMLRSRIRQLGNRLHWAWLDRVDRAIFTPPVEKAFARRFSVPRQFSSLPSIRRLYVDVSVIHQNDAGTGIQRVVRSLRKHLPVALDPSVELESLIVPNASQGYVTSSGEQLKGAPGSLFFGLDFATDSIYRTRHDLRAFKLAGGQIWFLVHDVLPLSHPQWFTHASCLKYRRWLRVCASLADGILCVSPVVAALLEDVFSSRFGVSELPRIATIELGSDILPDSRELDEVALPLTTGLDAAKFQRAALVVGTLEPRKGHADVLGAFDQLWKDSHDIPLVLIGRRGWNTQALQARIRQHPEHGRLLFWLEDVNDHELQAAYHHCRLAIVPSLAEGYGLPLDEALAQGTPVLARDIAVFRRHGEAPISYFSERASAVEIAAAIAEAHASATHLARRLTPLKHWDDTARRVAMELGCAA